MIYDAVNTITRYKYILLTQFTGEIAEAPVPSALSNVSGFTSPAVVVELIYKNLGAAETDSISYQI